MGEADEWRTQILDLLSAYTEPVSMLFLLAALSLGALTFRALA